MRLIITEKEFDPAISTLEKLVDRSKKFPENVFSEKLKHYLFITFYELFMEFFFDNLKRYMSESRENDFWMIAIDPDPKLYFGAHFNFFGTVNFSTADYFEDYLEALHNDPGDSPADALAYNSNSLVFFSSKCGWAIYGDRDIDVAVCAFADIEQMKLFKSIYGSDLLDGVDVAAEHAYAATGDDTSKATLRRSYGPILTSGP